MSFRHLILCLAAALGLLSCSTAEPTWAPDADVAAARFAADGPTSITLYTVISTRNRAGAHSGLIINGSQRVIFDPAGTWHHPRLPERNDVHFGMTDRMIAFYIDYHARETYDVVEQTVVVPPEVAEIAMRRAMEYGAVPKAQCALSVSRILSGVPGFENVGQTWFPKQLMADFAARPGVSTRTITDDDADNNHGVLLVQAEDAAQP
jgi:hypothetical protein